MLHAYYDYVMACDSVRTCMCGPSHNTFNVGLTRLSQLCLKKTGLLLHYIMFIDNNYSRNGIRSLP